MSFYRKPLFVAAMRRCARAASKYVPLFVVAFALMADGFGQGTGSIRGKVQNLATGKALVNARVEIVESGKSTLTDEYGVYRFANVSEGRVTVRANFVGLDPKSSTVDISSGVTTTADLSLFSSHYSDESEEVFELEAFTVDGGNYDSNTIALNEQRNSSNLKTVQHADAFGEIAEGNIGEYLKNLPGVSVNYVAADVRSIKLRGMSSQFTQVMVDGSQMASAGSGNKIRSFELEQVSLANVEQLEVHKLPLPSMPANAIGGAVNLVSKNAFQQDGRKASYKISFNFNDAESSLGETPGWVADGERSKILPGLELNWSDVFMDQRLGVAMTYKSSNMYNVQERFRWREWDLSPQGGDGDADDAYFLRLEVQDGPKKTSRESISTNVDFKVTEDVIFSFRGQVNTYDSTFFNRNVGWRISNEDDLSAIGITGSTDEVSDNSFTAGGNRGLAFGGSFRAKYGNTYHVDMGMKHNYGDWVFDYGFSHSEATNHYADNKRGFMETWEAGYRGDAEYIVFDQGNPDMMAFSDVKVYDENGNLLPDRGMSLSDFELRRTRQRPKESVDRITQLRANAKRNFTFGENQGYIKAGVFSSMQEREGYQLELRYDYDGYNTDGERIWFDEIRDDVFSGHSPGHGYEGFDWPSIGQIHDIYNSDTSVWDLDETRSVDSTIGTWFEAEEDINAMYLEGQLEFLGGNLALTGGIRYEDTSVTGRVPVVSDANYVLSPSSFYFETVSPDSGYDDVHPSLQARYNLGKNWVFRLGYANTIGRPDFGDMFGVVTIYTPQPDPDTGITDEDATGLVTTTNAGLLPRDADNIDFSAEFYYDRTGVFSMSLFQIDMENYIISTERDLMQSDVGQYGLPSYVYGGEFDYRIRTTDNIGTAKIEGIELNWKQDLDFDFMPGILRGSSIYANGTFLSTTASPEASVYENDFPDFAKTTVNYGFLFNQGPLDFKLRWNIRGDEIGGSSRSYEVNGVSGSSALFREKRLSLDFDLSYKLNEEKGTTLFLNARNLNDASHRQGYYLPAADGSRRFILERQEDFGTQYTVGVKGKF